MRNHLMRNVINFPFILEHCNKLCVCVSKVHVHIALKLLKFWLFDFLISVVCAVIHFMRLKIKTMFMAHFHRRFKSITKTNGMFIMDCLLLINWDHMHFNTFLNKSKIENMFGPIYIRGTISQQRKFHWKSFLVILSLSKNNTVSS